MGNTMRMLRDEKGYSEEKEVKVNVVKLDVSIFCIFVIIRTRFQVQTI